MGPTTLLQVVGTMPSPSWPSPSLFPSRWVSSIPFHAIPSMGFESTTMASPFPFVSTMAARRLCRRSGTRVSCAHGHVPVLSEAVLDVFRGKKVRAFVDGTLGAGGHASLLMQAHEEMELFVGFDRDRRELERAMDRLEAEAGSRDANGAGCKPEMRFVHDDFRRMKQHLQERKGVDGILLDLGVSSMQLDSEERGFSFLRPESVLDMRMDPTKGPNAQDVVNTWPEEELARIIREYGEDRRWKQLAQRIVYARNGRNIATVGELLEAVGMDGGRKRQRGKKTIHPATRLFQALRIAVNDELGAVEDAVPAAIDLLVPGGRLCVISFHSLEDRIVKNMFRRAAGLRTSTEEDTSAALAGLPRTMRLHMPEEERPRIAMLVNKKPIVASSEECGANPRSRSAKLRAVERL